MGQKRAAGTGGGEKTIRDIRRATRRQYSAEEKIRIVLDGTAIFHENVLPIMEAGQAVLVDTFPPTQLRDAVLAA